MTKYCEYVKYFPTKIIKAHITHMDYYHTLKLFLYFKRKHYMSLEETCGEGNGIVSSVDPFKYFLGKGWTTLIYCDPLTAHSITVSSALMMDFADFFFVSREFFLFHKA